MEAVILKIVVDLYWLVIFAGMHNILMGIKRNCKTLVEKIQFWVFALIFYILSIVGIVSTF